MAAVAVYLLGGPGVGKSTVMSYLLRDWTPGPYERLTSKEMFGHYMLNSELELGLYLGHLRPEYPGTDALSLSVAPQALLWLESIPPTLGWVFGEGVRLSHVSFLTALHERTRLTVVHLKLAPEMAAQRRAGRAGKVLSDRYCQQAAGRADSAAEACRQAGIRVLTLDTSEPPENTSKIVAERASAN